MVAVSTLGRAYLRLTLGIGQMAMAVVTVVFLIRDGIAPLPVGCFVVTGALTAISVLLFSSQGAKDGPELQRSLLTDPLPALLLIHLGALTDIESGRIVIHPRTLEGQWSAPPNRGAPRSELRSWLSPRVAAVACRGSDARSVASERAGNSRRPPVLGRGVGRRRPRDEQPSRRSVEARQALVGAVASRARPRRTRRSQRPSAACGHTDARSSPGSGNLD